MTSFIEEVIVDIQEKGYNLSELTFILPSKRSGVFLKHIISQTTNKTIFAPEILAIEEFVETISNLEYISNTELIFEFYEVYLKITPKDKIEAFESFSKWAQILIQDFNEIDRYLITPNAIFDYLTAIKEIELDHWSIDENQTQYIKNYLAFWKRIKNYYFELKDALISKGKGYQGLVYREAVGNLKNHLNTNKNKTYVFAGFNALNKAEETIIQELLQQNHALIYWDIDETFVKNPIHDAGLFIRSHQKNWPYLKQNPINWPSNFYTEEKNVTVIGTPKNIGQVKHIGELLQNIKKEQKSLRNTAIVLGNETLLMPLLGSIPEEVDAINITMGLPLHVIPMAALFEDLFRLHRNNTKTFYYKDVITLLSHQFVKPLLNDETENYAEKIISYIQTNNIVNINPDKINEIAGNKSKVTSLLFNSWNDNPTLSISNCTKLIFFIKAFLSEEKDKNLLALEYLYRFNEVFNELTKLNETYTHINNINTLYGMYKELIKTETLDFQGEPLDGLQIMGMLESRVLDFETVIISSVNEGILPAGKSNNSFIPFDVKLENGLPTYKEKDAVYTYHFYRLLQRAKNVYIIYNTEPDVLEGGEKSRFITQLEIEKIHPFKHYITAPKVPSLVSSLKEIKKTDLVLQRLKQIAERGFSPSSLTNYIRNPLDFYYQKVLGIKEFDDVEETVAANTLGTVIHNTLEDFYKPLEGKLLTEDAIAEMKKNIDITVIKHFTDLYKEGDMTRGKNLIVFEIAKRYVSNFLNLEIEDLKQGNTIKIVSIEANNRVEIDIPELDFPVFITGKVDRVDEYNGVIRIIDYKSGKVEQNKVEIVDWNNLTLDYDKYSKSFQILSYAYMMNKTTPFTNAVEGGIISFKNLSAGLLKFTKKDKDGRGAHKDTLITNDTLMEFEASLKQLIRDICDSTLNFVEKEV